MNATAIRATLSALPPFKDLVAAEIDALLLEA